jgi:long-chain acyl-CoA synthetase
MIARTRTLTALLDDHPARPQEPLVHCGALATSRGELDERVRGLASQLELALCGDETVGVCLQNGADAIAAWFAIWRAGGTVAPLNPRAPRSELQRLVDVARVTVVLTEGSVADRFPGTRLFDGPPVGIRVSPRVASADPACALMQFTSGTTGRPKAIPLEHETILVQLDPVIASLRLRGERRGLPMPNLIPMSLSLWAGVYNVLFAFRVGAPVVVMERFEPIQFARLVSEFAIKSSVLPPAALMMLLAEPSIESLEPLRYVRSVSAPLSPAQARRFHERFGIAVLNGYGQTELGGEAVGWTAEDWRRCGATKLGSVGRPHENMEVRVRAETGAVVQAGELGEVEIRPREGRPRDSEGLAGRLTADGWLRTGDVGHFDVDGFLWIEGRVSAMINRGGLKVFPDEVEEALRSYAGIADVAVVGVPDERLGEVPYAFLVPDGNDALDLEAVRAWCRERLVAYKVPVAFLRIAALPRNDIGKVVRDQLVALARK